MKSCRKRLLRLISGVKAKPSLGPERVVDSLLEVNSGLLNRPASQRYLDHDATAKHRAVQLRLGGAQMLSGTRSRIGNNNEAHPLFYSNQTPATAGLAPALVHALKLLHIYRLTELQGALVPLLLRGKHVVAHAETGTGKSFGIALATANRIIRDHLNHSLHTVILVPTEELALQYDKWLKHFGGCASQVSQCAIESIPLEAQLAKLHNIQPSVLVGTCQRIADIIVASPSIIGEPLRRRVDTVVLDEADMLLSQPVTFGRRKMCGADVVDRLYRTHRDEIPAQMVAASATIDGATAMRLNTWMHNDKAVRLTTSFAEHTIPPSISFYFFACDAASNLPSVDNRSGVVGRRSQGSLGVAGGAIVPNERPESAQRSTRYSLVRGLELVLRLIIREYCLSVIERARSSSTSTDSSSRKFVPRPRVLLFSSQSPSEMVACLSSVRAAVEGEWSICAGNQGPAFPFPEFGGPLQEPPAPDNPNRLIKAKQIVGRNREIYLKNDSTVSKMAEGKLLVGVGTHDVSRGMHIPNVTHVILFGETPPPAQFVHCAGRTGRMDKSGEVICLFPPSEGRALQSTCQALEIPFKLHRLSTVDDMLHARNFVAPSAEQENEAVDSSASATPDDRHLESERESLSHDPSLSQLHERLAEMERVMFH